MKYFFKTAAKAVFFVCLFTLSCVPAFALETGSEPTNVIDRVYPMKITMEEKGGVMQLEKTYLLSSDEEASRIPIEDFKKDGYRYSLMDLLKNEQVKTEIKPYTETVSVAVDSNDRDMAIQRLQPTILIQTDDGYVGTLSLDVKSVAVKPTGYANKVKRLSSTRTYPNLSDADISFIPKTVEENGKILSLEDIAWQQVTENTIDGHGIAGKYTATATYTAASVSKYATGYTATASYQGELKRESASGILYTAIFTGSPVFPGQGIIFVLAIIGGAIGYSIFAYHKGKVVKE